MHPRLGRLVYSKMLGMAMLAKKAIVGRIVYRHQRRGFLELELLLKHFVSMNDIKAWREQELGEFEQLLNEKDHDLYAWMTKKAAVPDRLATNSCLQWLSDSVGQRPTLKH